MRSRNKMNKSQLARELGVSRAYITMIANGKRKPSQEFVNKLNATYYGLDATVNNNM